MAYGMQVIANLYRVVVIRVIQLPVILHPGHIAISTIVELALGDNHTARTFILMSAFFGKGGPSITLTPRLRVAQIVAVPQVSIAVGVAILYISTSPIVFSAFSLLQTTVIVVFVEELLCRGTVDIIADIA